MIVDLVGDLPGGAAGVAVGRCLRAGDPCARAAAGLHRPDTSGLGVLAVLVTVVLLVVAGRTVLDSSRELHRRHGIARDYVGREHG